MAKCIKNGNFVTVVVVLLNVFELIPFPDLTLRLLDNQSTSPEVWHNKARIWRRAVMVAKSRWSEPRQGEEGVHVEVGLVWELEPTQLGEEAHHKERRPSREIQGIHVGQGGRGTDS